MNTLKNYFTFQYWKELLQEFGRALCTKKFWKEFIVLNLGIGIGAAAVYYFLMPSHLIIGTISGLSIVLNTLFGGTADTFSYWVMGINAVLLILAFLLIGNEFGVKTVYTAMILGPLTQLCDRIYPYVNLTHQVVDNPQVLSALQAGQTVLDVNGNPYILNRAGEVMMQVKDSVMSAGLGLGDVWFDLVCFVLLLSACQAILFRINASSGGLDILAKIINKYLHFDIGMSVSIGGALICCTAFMINDFRMVVIGLIGTWINGVVVNYFTATMDLRKRVCIITEDYEKVRSYIVKDLLRGCSLYRVEGGYSREEYIEIQALLTQEEFANVLAFMRENNIKAFTTAGNCSEVYGLWAKHRKRRGKLEIEIE
jgi:uncharacterized membrane-anchored protein YitT (DUF2179 family)